MLKYLLLGLLIAWLIFASPWRRSRPGSTASTRKPTAPPSPQEMVACAHCGVHMPANEALVAPSSTGGSHHFCSDDHRRAGPRPR